MNTHGDISSSPCCWKIAALLHPSNSPPSPFPALKMGNHQPGPSAPYPSPDSVQCCQQGAGPCQGAGDGGFLWEGRCLPGNPAGSCMPFPMDQAAVAACQVRGCTLGPSGESKGPGQGEKMLGRVQPQPRSKAPLPPSLLLRVLGATSWVGRGPVLWGFARSGFSRQCSPLKWEAASAEILPLSHFSRPPSPTQGQKKEEGKSPGWNPSEEFGQSQERRGAGAGDLDLEGGGFPCCSREVKRGGGGWSNPSREAGGRG